MDKNKVLAKLEQDLSFFMISEMTKNDPSKRGSSETYKYKGLSISTNEKEKGADKVAAISIGALEAHFKIENGDKVFGNLSPNDERLVQIWMCQPENIQQFKAVFNEGKFRNDSVPIIPFDLEEFYS